MVVASYFLHSYIMNLNKGAFIYDVFGCPGARGSSKI